MKKLLKSEICGSVNNVRYALIDWKLPDKSNFAAIFHALVITVKFVPKRVKKKKEKKEKRKTQTQTQSPNPNVA